MNYFLNRACNTDICICACANKYVSVGVFPFIQLLKGPGGSMSQIVGLPNNSYKPITNTAWVRARLCKLQKGCTPLAAPSDKDYQLIAHGRWFSPGTPASSTTKTGRHDIAEIYRSIDTRLGQLKTETATGRIAINRYTDVVSHLLKLGRQIVNMSILC